MKPAYQIREELERQLEERIPAALTPHVRGPKEAWPTGITELDERLNGGLPAGAVTEIVGRECTGRTTTALSFLAGCTAQGKVCAWVDVSDALCPETAEAAGVDLERLLWVRCGARAGRVGDEVRAGAAGNLKPMEREPVLWHGGGSLHPRSEAVGLSAAVGDFLQPRKAMRVGTPGAENRPVGVASFGRVQQRQEQTNSDRLPPRRGENLQLSVAAPEWQPRREASVRNSRGERPWGALDQALRAVDLLLQAGGFSVIVLDMGSIAAEFALRVPLATWFRFRAAAERTQTCMVLLTQHSCAKTSADLVLQMTAGEMQAEGKVMTGIAYRAEIERQRERAEEKVVSIRKPPKAEKAVAWKREASWAGGDVG